MTMFQLAAVREYGGTGPDGCWSSWRRGGRQNSV